MSPRRSLATAIAVTTLGGWDIVAEGDALDLRGRGGTAEDIHDRVRYIAAEALTAEHYVGLVPLGSRCMAVAYAGPAGGVDGAPPVVERHDLEALAALGRFLGWLSGQDYDWPDTAVSS